MLLFNYLHLLFNSLAFQIDFILLCPVCVNAHITNIIHFRTYSQALLLFLSWYISLRMYSSTVESSTLFSLDSKVFDLLTMKGVWLQSSVATNWDWRMYRYGTLGIACVSYLQSGQLTKIMNQCGGIPESLRLPEKKTPGNNWDGTTCGSLWGVVSNPLCPELWIPEVHWNW